MGILLAREIPSYRAWNFAQMARSCGDTQTSLFAVMMRSNAMSRKGYAARRCPYPMSTDTIQASFLGISDEYDMRSSRRQCQRHEENVGPCDGMEFSRSERSLSV